MIFPAKRKPAALFFQFHWIPALVIICLLVSSCSKKIGIGDKEWNRLVDKNRQIMDMGGFSLHYIDIGKGDPLLLIHGYADSSYCWHKNLPPLLDAGFRVIAVDQPGLGRSALPPEPYVYSMENQADKILTLMDRMGIKRFRLMGHSMGGGIALYLCLKHPERIIRASVIAPACYEPDRNGRCLSHLPGADAVTSLVLGKPLVRMTLKKLFTDDSKISEAMVDEYARFCSKPGYARVINGLSRDYFSKAHKRMTTEYNKISTPLLIVWGKKDPWLAPSFGEQLHREIPASVFSILPDTGHNPHQERPDLVNPLLVEFFTTPMAAGDTGPFGHSLDTLPVHPAAPCLPVRSGLAGQL